MKFCPDSLAALVLPPMHITPRTLARGWDAVPLSSTSVGRGICRQDYFPNTGPWLLNTLQFFCLVIQAWEGGWGIGRRQLSSNIFSPGFIPRGPHAHHAALPSMGLLWTLSLSAWLYYNFLLCLYCHQTHSIYKWGVVCGFWRLPHLEGQLHELVTWIVRGRFPQT